MPTVLSQLDQKFRAAVKAAFDIDADPLLANSQNEKFGDYQSNAAMGLSKILSEKTGQKSNPRGIAEEIKGKLELGGMASEISIAGPGFINVRLSPEWVATQLAAPLVEKVVHPLRIVVDYSAPNIAKEMHVGHLRSTIIGDAISRILEDAQGHTVIRQNHIGDWGTQFGKVVFAMWYTALAKAMGKTEYLEELISGMSRASAEKNASEETKIVHQAAVLDQGFVDEDPSGRKRFLPRLRESPPDLGTLERVYQFVGAITGYAAAKHETIIHPEHGPVLLSDIPRLTTTFIQHMVKDQNEPERVAWQTARDITLETCKEVYRRLQVRLKPGDVRGESDYNDILASVVAELKEKGIAIESKGAVVVPVPGFESPLIIQKSDSGYLYGTTDLAAIRYRVRELHADRVIYTHDSRQQQHFAQVFWTAEKAGWAKPGTLFYAPFGTMLGEDGKPFRTRSGGTVKLKELLDEAEERALKVVTEKNPELAEHRRKEIAHAVGIGGVKYSDLAKDRISDYHFSYDKMLALDGNTAPYLQYAHARICSIFRKDAGQAKEGAAIQLESPFELALAKHILRFGEIVDLAARELKPHHLCTYLYELATRFSAFYENCPVLQSEPKVRGSRLALCKLTATALECGMDLLGIEHPEQM